MNNSIVNPENTRLMEEYKALKGFIEQQLSKNEVAEKLRQLQVYPFNQTIEGDWQKTSADSRHHKTDINIVIDEGKVKATVAEYYAETIGSDFPFKGGDHFLRRINKHLHTYKNYIC